MTCLISALMLASPPVGPHVGLEAAAHRDCPTFGAREPILGTYFFYWYNDQTREHFVNGDGSDAMTTHPLRREGERYSYDALEWWRGELADVRAAGIDFIAPVYWGTPENDPRFAWSYTGLRTLAELIAQQQAAGEPVMPVAMFYDTSTLQHNSSGYHVELDTERGRVWFYETIRNFWSLIPPVAWCRIDGRPLILLYGPGFAKSHDEALFADFRRRFVADFGVEPYLVKHMGWPGEADGVVTWGGALGLKDGTVAALGPGYDHTAVPGRQPLIVEREGGQFYVDQWHKLLARDPASRPSVVLVETWNEWHEGTDVAPSVEYGRLFVDWTRWFANQWHAGGRLPRSGPFATAQAVMWQAGEDGLGITLRSGGDGLWRAVEQGGRAAVTGAANPHSTGRYLYFDVDWSYGYDLSDGALEVGVLFWDAGATSLALEYDSRDPAGSVREGAFKAGGSIALGGTAQWRRTAFRLDDPRLADRSNGGDFRLFGGGGDIVAAEVTVSWAR